VIKEFPGAAGRGTHEFPITRCIFHSLRLSRNTRALVYGYAVCRGARQCINFLKSAIVIIIADATPMISCLSANFNISLSLSLSLSLSAWSAIGLKDLFGESKFTR